jgi:MscS family membrane protein
MIERDQPIRNKAPWLALIALVVLLGTSPLAAQQTTSASDGANDVVAPRPLHDVHVALTESPRDTLTSFGELRDDLVETFARYTADETTAVHEQLILILEQLRWLIDLSEVSRADRDTVTVATIGYLLDIFERVPLPDPEDVPDEETLAKEALSFYRIPGTPLRIVRIADGDRAGEFLFSSRTISVAPRFYRAIENEPILMGRQIRNWSWLIPQSTGPAIPTALVRAIPFELKSLWFGTPVWKVIVIVLLAVIALVLLGLLHRFIPRRTTQSRIVQLTLRIIQPVAILALVGVGYPFLELQLGVAGAVSRIVNGVTVLVICGAAAWLFWLVTKLFFEWLILSPRIRDESLDANLLRLIAGIIGIVGVTIILGIGGQTLGLPVLSMVAGLGIGGVAVALAIRPTLENLIGGFVLYIDKPIRVGDFCTFGDHTGTVETIGVRSVQIRSLDRTLITVPNAQFADMQIINWARCDQMMIHHIIGLRYETDDDQLRYVLAKIREMFYGHPRIDSDTVRVRFVAYGPSSQDIEIRVYARTREWNDFYAIQEDVLLRISEIVKKSGTGFAFPSQTVYMARDDGLDAELEEKAKLEVAQWRRAGQLPFPRFAAAKLKQVDGRLDYPPHGSPDFNAAEQDFEEGEERLSVEPVKKDSSNPEGGEASAKDPSRD